MKRIIVLTAVIATALADENLRLVIGVARHGARSP